MALPLDDTTPADLAAERARQRDVAAMTIVLLNVLDVLVTQFILRTHPVSREGNPFLAHFVLSPWVWLVKAGLPLFVLASCRRAPVTRFSYAGMFVVWAIYWGVIGWNLHILLG